MIIRIKRFPLYIFIFSAAIFISGCKSKKKPSIIKKAYHNVTAHYNGYFNARQRVLTGEQQLKAAHIDKYDEILKIYRLGDEKDAKAVFTLMDEAIKKTSLVIQRHEVSSWMDDCYLLIGKAYFYKRDYYGAIEAFRFVAGKYKNTHIGNEAYIWMIKSYVQIGRMTDAESTINIALDLKKFPKDLMADLYTATANYYISKANYSRAIDYLENAISLEKKRQNKIRYTYILAQLQEKEGDNSKAVVNYQRVIRMNPPYEMAFNAKINSARIFETRTLASKKGMEKQLNKLLKDDKNKDFRDQIYYALGSIYENESDEKKAITFYKLSAATSVTNTTQKGLTFYKLATLYYDDADYEPAQIYYDSASVFISKNFSDYELIVSRKTNLAKLVKNLRVIAFEDSVQKLGKLSEKDLSLAIDKIVKKDLQEKERKEAEEKLSRENISLDAITKPNQNNLANAGGNTWYFYNTSAISLGYSDFLKRYGRRVLEDNWRRANKESFNVLNIQEDEEKENTEGQTKPGKSEQEKLKSKYLKNIPITEEQLKASDEKIANAYFNIGTFYKEDLINYNESIKYYEKLLKRYPDNKLKLECYFTLYRLYLNIKNTNQSNYYKNKLLNEYPNSVFAKVILDPDYISENQELEKSAEKYYQTTYQYFSQGNYQEVQNRKIQSDSLFKSSKLAPNFAYLNAMCYAKTGRPDAFENELKLIVTKFPGTDISNLAKEVLLKIEERKNPSQDKPKSESDIQYIKETRANYIQLIVVDLKSNVNPTQVELARFNSQSFSLDNLKISTQLLNDNKQMILIKGFDDITKVNNYQNTLRQKESEVMKFAKQSYITCFISEKNFVTLIKAKEITNYLQFYNANYPIINE